MKMKMKMKIKIERKSKEASLLKSLISRHLLHLSPHFSDDVLSEYITVLVCNGKNQNQAIDDLTAFLGQRTEEFVSWLWKLLPKNETQLSALLSSSDSKDKTCHSSCERETNRDKAKESRTLKNHPCEGNSGSVNLMDDAELPKNHHSIFTPPKERTHKPNHSSVPQSKVSKSDSTKVSSLDRKYETERVHGLEKRSQTDLVQKESTSVLNYAPMSEEKSLQCSKLSDSSERRPRAGMRNSNIIKLSSNSCIQDILKYAPASEENSPHCSELSDKNFSAILGKVPNSFLERKPDAVMQNSNGSKLSECPPMSYAANAFGTSFSLQPVVPSSQSNQSRQSVWDRLGKPQLDVRSRSQITDVYAMDKKQCEERNIQSSSLTKGQLSTFHPLPRVLGTARLRQVPSSNSGRKRQFDELGSHVYASKKTENRTHNQRERACQSQKISEASQSFSPQLNYLKLRLCQIEKEMVNMRTKTSIFTSSGLANPTEDESRTILVNNVHLKATKETISLYFQKCGAVVNVILLNDNMPARNERSAYITFRDKEAANRALRYNGASFYSKTIKVSRKGEFSSTTESAQNSGQKTQISSILSQCS